MIINEGEILWLTPWQGNVNFNLHFPLKYIIPLFSGNNKFNQEAMDATFFLSNIVPQNLDNNANYWYRLEAYCRGLTKRYSSVYIVSGPLYLPKEEDGKKIVKYEVCLVSNCFETFQVLIWFLLLPIVPKISALVPCESTAARVSFERSHSRIDNLKWVCAAKKKKGPCKVTFEKVSYAWSVK